MANSWYPASDMPDLTGKVVVVTGGSTGIGLATVKHLALKNAHVYFTSQSKAKGASAREQILSNNPSVRPENLTALELQLADVKSVVRAVEEFRARVQKIDILVNNAAIVPELGGGVNDAGWEMSMAVNYFGHFIFTNGLFPLLETAAAQPASDVRIVTLASNIITVVLPGSYPFDYSSPTFFTGAEHHEPWLWRRVLKSWFRVDLFHYAVSKLACVMFARELQRRLDERDLPILSVSLNPGAVRTGGALAIGEATVTSMIRRFAVPEDEGARNSLWAGTAAGAREEEARIKGRYLEPVGKVSSIYPAAEDREKVRALWKNTTAEANKHLAKSGLPPLSEW